MGGTMNKCRCTQTDTPPGYVCEGCGGSVLVPGERYPWTIETMCIINRLTPDIKGKAFDIDWFLLRQRFEQFESLVNGAQQPTVPDSDSKFPPLFVIASRKRGQLQWSISGFRPYRERDKAEIVMNLYREKCGAKYEYRVVEYIPQ